MDYEYEIDKVMCKCGKASVELIYDCDDQWIAKLDNASAKCNEVNDMHYKCNLCGEVFYITDKNMRIIDFVDGLPDGWVGIFSKENIR